MILLEPPPGTYAVVAVAPTGAGSARATGVVRVWQHNEIVGAAELDLAAGEIDAALRLVIDTDDVCIDDFLGASHCRALASDCSQADGCGQCTTNAECGPNTRCDVDAQLCVDDLALCANASGCAEGDICPEAIDACVVGCTSVSDCAGAGVACDVDTGTCFTPVANCGVEEGSEPVELDLADGDATFSGTVCSLDNDFFYLNNVATNRTITVTVTSDGEPLPISIVDTLQGTVMATGAGSVSITVGFASFLGIAVDGPLAIAQTEYELHVSATEIDDPACALEPGEPDNDPQSAQHVGLGTTTARMCQDFNDYFSVDISPAQIGRVTFDTEGELHVVTSDGETLLGDYSITQSGVSIVIGRPTFQLRFIGPGGTSFPYSFTVEAGCAEDVNEPDDDAAQGRTLGTAPIDGFLCGATDRDSFLIDLDVGERASLVVTSDTGIGAEFRPLGSDGPFLFSTELPASRSAVTWHVVLTGSIIDGGPYTVSPSITTVPECLVAAVGDGHDPTASPCLGAADADPVCASTLPAPLITPGLKACIADPSQPGCGIHCGVSDDFIRLGALPAGAVVRATVSNLGGALDVTVSLGRYDGATEEILEASQLANGPDGFLVQELDATVPADGQYDLVISGFPDEIVFAVSASIDP